MNRFLGTLKDSFKKNKIRRTFKRIGFVLIGLFILLLLSSIGLAIYVNQNKAEIIAEINQQISENINGKLDIEDIHFKFLKGFPNATFALEKVVLKDSLWYKHKHTFMNAKEIEVRLNVWNLINDKIDIRKIVINEATLVLFKDQNGYSNTYLLKPKLSQNNSINQTTINEIVLNKVNFVAKNLKEKKLFHFEILSLKSKLKYSRDHIKTNLKVKSLVKSMIFKPKNGSFLKDKWVEGVLAIDFMPRQNLMTISANKLKIDKNRIALKAQFNLGKFNSNFKLDLKTEISWGNMTKLLTPNISKKLVRFDFKKPLIGSCVISGKWNVKGNPKIVIQSKIINNELKTPDGTFSNCYFDIEYNNNYINGKGHNDPNSVIVLKNVKGSYKTIPFEIPIAKIINLKKPIAIGKFRTNFEIQQLNQFISDKLLDFNSGQASVNFDFNINIVDLKLNKPKFTGNVLVSNAKLEYVPKNLVFQNTDIQLDFTDHSLLIKKIRFQDRVNTVYMEGKIDHFLSLYYSDSDKMVVNWNIYSPFLDVQQFLGLLSKKSKKEIVKPKNRTPFSEKLRNVFEECQAVINLKADKIVYGDVFADYLRTTIQMDNNTLKIKKSSLKTLGGSLYFDAVLTPKENFYIFHSNTQIQNLDLNQVLGTLNNFGLKSFKSQKIKGKISANTSISGILLPKGKVMHNSISMDINNGIINSLGGNIVFNGKLFPKNKMYSFYLNTQVNQISAAEVLTTYNNFGLKSLKTQYINGKLSAQTTISGQLLSNWRLNSNSIHLDVNNGTLKSFDGDISFDAHLMPKNKWYAFTTSTQIDNVDLDQFMSTFNYFGVKSLEQQKIKGRFSTMATLNGMLLSSGNLLDNSIEIELKKGSMKSLGGGITFEGKLYPKNKMYDFNANAKINQVDIEQFLKAFDNFGITSFKPKNINGYLNSSAAIHGVLQPNGAFVKNSITGDAVLNINDGALIDFEPIKNVWKIIFPFRDFDNITFSSISGNLKLNGDKVNVDDFKVNSNVMNFDMEGVYAFNKGTHLELTIPIRNPKKDEKISDEIKKMKKRDNGIVLHLVAVDGPDGKVKIKWNKKHKKENK